MIMNDLFDTYLNRITPTETEFQRARAHRDIVRSRIKLEGATDFINSGSYIKRTAIRPFTDIDLFVGFDRNGYDDEEKKIITRLSAELKLSFPERVRAQRHSVGVAFADGIRVDVVPGFAIKSRPRHYRVRNRIDGRWVETSVEGHRDFFDRQNARDRRFRDMVKLIKAWKNARRLSLGSYLMELLAAKAYQKGIPQGRDRALHEFFTWMTSGALERPIIFTHMYRVSDVQLEHRDPMVVLDPTNWRNNVAGSLSSAAVDELLNVADRGRARSGTALNVATSRREAAAIWGELLPGFPSP